MRIDLRVKHGVETRRLAADLFADGLGCAAAKGRGSSRQRAARSYLATTRRVARPHGSQITARNPAVAMP